MIQWASCAPICQQGGLRIRNGKGRATNDNWYGKELADCEPYGEHTHHAKMHAESEPRRHPFYQHLTHELCSCESIAIRFFVRTMPAYIQPDN